MKGFKPIVRLDQNYLQLKKTVWVAYAPPVDPIDHNEPVYRVLAPVSWGRDRVFEALEDWATG
jgi:hypothetical protein